ncbi:MAG: pilus assembly protein PilP [Polyangiaceae bacterium]
MSRPPYLLVAALLAFFAVGCEDEFKPPAASNAAATSAATAAPSASASAKAVAEIAREFDEADFVESDDNRDPFRSFEEMFLRRATGTKTVQRKVKAGSFTLEELRLTAIVGRSVRRLMLTDPSGFGWVLYTGDYVGKPEFVGVGGNDGQEIPLNWRVDRIRKSDVVFIREDASHPEIPPTTRVVPLYPAGEGDNETSQG